MTRTNDLKQKHSTVIQRWAKCVNCPKVHFHLSLPASAMQCAEILLFATKQLNYGLKFVTDCFALYFWQTEASNVCYIAIFVC